MTLGRSEYRSPKPALLDEEQHVSGAVGGRLGQYQPKLADDDK